LAKFNLEQVAAFVAVQELINTWAHDLDMHNGLNIAALVTDDCLYTVGNTPLQGRTAVEKSYQDRLKRLSAETTGVPTLRHMISNLCVSYRNAHEVSITFSLLFFTSASGRNVPDPAAVADVRMDCRREADEHWRIARFDSNQPFRRVPV
jgi:SnoaL-like domain